MSNIHEVIETIVNRGAMGTLDEQPYFPITTSELLAIQKFFYSQHADEKVPEPKLKPKLGRKFKVEKKKKPVRTNDFTRYCKAKNKNYDDGFCFKELNHKGKHKASVRTYNGDSDEVTWS